MEYAYVGLIIVVFLILNVNINALQQNQKRVESKLDRIIEYIGLPELSREYIGDELKEELIRLVKGNEKIKAIKKLRDATGIELREAKDYIDSL
ncbi:ribosomal protein L7/L12 [Alkaliphilus oremlandii]|uniref:Large ribosomal subunit protein bL12 C-terminal domain-containing protein n=1 Tax=Alkaliphilus oremlandii (strain OhILAs) TaxID=350688 RepID=A8MI92_ALKOO|nr:ribosomal protein L7/L12 [Alkaliphilus oremlandii]ABW19524.1 conserved hypothetical protein [Alkaliphilus oremlandii OhILAs]